MGNISSKTMSKATISSLLISSLHLLFGPVWFIWRYLMIFVLELPVRAPVLRFAFWSYCLAAGRLAVSFLRVYVFSPSINLQDPPRSSKPLIGRLWTKWGHCRCAGRECASCDKSERNRRRQCACHRWHLRIGEVSVALRWSARMVRCSCACTGRSPYCEFALELRGQSCKGELEFWNKSEVGCRIVEYRIEDEVG